VRALDTSVAVPALVSWHEAHDRCRPMAAGASIPGHALVETYAVLTRLPSPHRLGADVAAELLGAWFPDPRVLAAPAGLQRGMVRRLANARLAGGAVYDALVALTAAEHDQVLLTRDERATRTYEALGIAFELIDA
jgi:predicted nucleic acid-binding protein